MSTVTPAQRKDVDGLHARDNGIQTPHIYHNFVAAQQASKGGEIVIARTEHPSELAGLSGINYSFVLQPDMYPAPELFPIFQGDDETDFLGASRMWHMKWFHVKNHCQENGLDIDTYVGDLDHSYWEYIEGANLFVVEDPVVQNRFRIFTCWWKNEEGFTPSSYSVFDTDTCVKGYDDEDGFLRSNMPQIIAMYRDVQRVFGSGENWVVEMQITQSGDLFFLQRSRGVAQAEVDWSFADTEDNTHLTVGIGHDYGEVIGATSAEGIEVTLILDRGTRLSWLTDKPNAALKSHFDSTVKEQEAIRALDLYVQQRYVSHAPGGIPDPHSQVIPITRAPLYLHMKDFDTELPKDICDQIQKLERKKLEAAGWVFKEGGGMSRQGFDRPEDDRSNPASKVRLRMNVRSDGREARLKVLEVF